MDDETLNQENNQFLLNAIKNKFAAQSVSEAASFSPPKFTIPMLKSVSGATLASNGLKLLGANAAAVTTAAPLSSKLNQFILGQLHEKNAASDGFGFDLPKLQMGNQANEAHKPDMSTFTIPLLKTKNPTEGRLESSLTNVAAISSGISNLTVNEAEASSSTIDLTTALSGTHNCSTTLKTIPRLRAPIPEDFQTVFMNEYCQSDVSNLNLPHSLTSASGSARIICLNYKSKRPLQRINHGFKVKHKIERFRFDTKSPDDIILAALAKYQRQHHN